ncbi:hypothetical protein CDL15_Pgr016699 [Punica granatum]|uniref:Bet v I/Major latex protein domain-containing protein n=1 Tax=Punica granatum TaxID=22663 RepID=A0A218XU01_PUNGR|nr:hypothetical protein CDL15_Pgr016699 [Punica granatum]PKI56712.1 hypothetical protein CRG98_022872 [Punica granatum]
MNVPCSYHEFVIPVSRDRVFKAVVIDGHNLLPKLLSNVIKSVKLTKGDGGPGTISRTIFKSGREDVYRVDVIDPENYVLKATLIEGSIWMKERKVESLVYEVRYIASGPNKCIIQIATEFHPKEGITLEEGDFERAKRGNLIFYQTVVGYLIENPDAYV